MLATYALPIRIDTVVGCTGFPWLLGVLQLIGTGMTSTSTAPVAIRATR